MTCSRAWERPTTPVATGSISPRRPPGWSERQGGVPVPVSRLCGGGRQRVVDAASRTIRRRRRNVYVLCAPRDACMAMTTGRHDRLQRPAVRLPLATARRAILSPCLLTDAAFCYIRREPCVVCLHLLDTLMSPLKQLNRYPFGRGLKRAQGTIY